MGVKKVFNFKRVFKHKLFESSVIYTLTDAVNKAVPFLLLPVLTRYLIPAEYGIVSNYGLYVYVLTIFVGLNLSGLISVNFFKIKKEDMAEYMFNVLFIVIISFFVCGLTLLLFQTYIKSILPVSFFFLFWGLAIALGQIITTINLQFWQLEEKPLSFGFYQILQTLLNLVLTLIFIVLFKWGWGGRIYAIGIASIVFGFFSMFLLHKRGYLKAKLNVKYITEALKFGIPLLPHTLSIWIRSAIDRILLTKYFGIEVAGIYSTGFQFGLLISFLTLAFNNAYIPFLYQNLSVEEPKEIARRKKKIVAFTYFYMLGLMCVALGFVLFSNFIVDHFLNAKYVSSKKFIVWAIFSQTFQGMYLMFVCFIFYVKKTSLLAWITLGCSLIQVVFSYFLIQAYGPIGAAYSTVLVSFLNFLVVWIYSNKVYNMPWNIFAKHLLQ